MLEITPVKAFSDNYLWLFRQSGSSLACVVDPGDASPVLEALAAQKLELCAILLTHHHADHIGGVNELLSHFDVPVYGPESKAIPQVSHPMHEGDTVRVCETDFRVLEIPGHTLDHIAYFAQAPGDSQAPVLFCGDTLFAAGCGRIFEGTAPMMYDSLQKLAALDERTEVYCAHEYTLGNLAFAVSVTPKDEAVNARMKVEENKRKQNLPTLPSTIARERETNPFLRCDQKDFRLSLQGENREPVALFAELRSGKDNF